MKILLINFMETTYPGGINKAVREIANNLSKNHEVTVLQSNPFNLSSEENYEEFNIIRVSSWLEKYTYGLNPEFAIYLKKHFHELNPDIIHIHGYTTLFSIEAIHIIKKMNKKAPIILSPHYSIFSRNTFAGKYFSGIYNQLIGKRSIKKADIIIASSNFEADNLKKYLNVPEEKIKIITHGINNFNPVHNKKKEGLINLLYVGYLLELKGVQYILEAMNELINKKKVPVCLRIVGEGPYRDKLKKIADELDLNEFIIWEGFIQNSNMEKLLEYYKKADILLLLSQSENYGIVVIESLAMGTPAIVTKRTALKEFLDEPGCFGVEYPPNPKVVADLILEIYKTDVNVGPLSEKIRTWCQVVKEYENLYIDVLKDKERI
ncbi:glycosyltransferase family 4 protein [Methanobacterium alkalithermotolerans]|uniref:Glycosyltransferase family 4 protein n=1 Tax=Methanobacterium alkalithermotolerans TaxID=2731220 RepID=A0A8T8K405_9EURY|nr:glycosyltransferase family 4 protein [Methanobacterium alkalithermotolerans]QUH22622.1 glycosyltransferase family 4 protein [Methanobacterium alkalithermotolerans]